MTVERLRQLHDEARKAYGHMILLGQGIGALDRERREAIREHDEVFGPASEPDVLGALLDIAEAAQTVASLKEKRDGVPQVEVDEAMTLDLCINYLRPALSRLDTEGGT